MKHCLFIAFLIFSSSVVIGQETFTFANDQAKILKATELFDSEEYGLCCNLLQQHFQNRLFNQKTYISDAEILFARAQLKMQIESSEERLETCLKKYQASSISSNAHFELANHYFLKNDFTSTLSHFAQLSTEQLTKEQLEELNFKIGYSHFVKKNFTTAHPYFQKTQNKQSPFYHSSIYYDGMCSYFEKDYDTALSSFKTVQAQSEYKKYIPYYITQILFANNEMVELISYGEKQIKTSNLKNLNRIKLLLGQAYFKQENYKKALEHLEFYEANTTKLTKEEFYQLAFTQYQNANYKKAIDNFSEISSEKNKMGQLSNYYLADCFFKAGDKNSARAAFKRVSAMSFEKDMQKEARFNYGKLSMEQGFDAEAISVLSSLNESSSYYKESQALLANLFLRTKDYNRSIKAIESIPNSSKELNLAYHRLTLSAGLQAYSDGEMELALSQLFKSLQNEDNQETKAQALFWKSMIWQNKKNYKKSIESFDEYFKVAGNQNIVDNDYKPYKAYYYQAYNHLKRKEHKAAYQNFDRSIKSNNVGDQELLKDASLRAADCLFAVNDYGQAKKYYNRLYLSKNRNAPYAMYQNSLIEGLEGNTYDKIVLLEELIESYPKSSYTDDAYMQLGDSYTQLNKNTEAFESYQSLIFEFQDKSPLINIALLKLGLSSYNQGDLSTALKFYKKVMNNNPSSNESDEAMAAIEEIYIQDLGQSKEFLSYLEALPNYEISEDSKDSLNYKIAEIQFENAEYSKAIISYNDYIKGNKNGRYVLEAYYHLAESQRFTKDYERSLNSYEYVINRGINEYYGNSLKNAALISYHQLKDFEKAYHYNKAIFDYSLDPEIKKQANAEAMQSAYKADKLKEAGQIASKIFNDKEASTEHKVIAAFILGKYSIDNKQTDQAISSFNYVVRNNKAALSAEASYELSLLYFNVGKLDESEMQCKSTNTVSSNYPFWIAKSLLLLSEIYIAKDDLYNARAATEAVIENFKDDPEIIAQANEKLKQIKIREDVENRVLNEPQDELLQLDNGN